MVNSKRVPEAQPRINIELLFVSYSERVLSPWLPFEQVNDGVYRVCLELLMLEFEFHEVTSLGK